MKVRINTYIINDSLIFSKRFWDFFMKMGVLHNKNRRPGMDGGKHALVMVKPYNDFFKSSTLSRRSQGRSMSVLPK